MAKITNILMVGVGGQGIVLASDIMASAALFAGYDVKKSEIHGMSQRGGSVFSHVRFGKKVFSPVIPEGKADIVVSLEEMETLRWLNYVHAGTKIIVAKTRIMPPNIEKYPEGIEQVLQKQFVDIKIVDPLHIQEKTGSAKVINTALLGLVSTFLDFNDEAWQRSLQANVPEGTYEKNQKAFEIGKSL